MDKIKILISDLTVSEASSWIPTSGISTMAMELYGLLSNISNIDVRVLTVGKDQNIINSKINVVNIGKRGNINRLRIKNDIDIIHSVNTRLVDTKLYSKKIDIPIIQTAWYYPHSLYLRLKNELQRCQPRYPLLSHMGTIKWNFDAFLKDQKAFQKATRIVAVTKILQGQLQDRFDGKIVDYVPCPINTDIFKTLEYKKSKDKDKDYITLLFIGKASNPQKGFRYIQKAIRDIKKLDKSIKLKIVGPIDNSVIEDLKRFCIVEHTPFLKRDLLPNVFVDSDIFIFPSVYEEFGYVVLEAMACGMPIVASDIHSMRDILDGTGALFPPGDVCSLQEQIINLIEDHKLREQCGKDAMQRVMENFSYKKVGKDFLEIYEKTLAKI